MSTTTDYSTKSLNRTRAIRLVLSKILFFLLPFIALTYVFLIEKRFLDLFATAEWSFAAAILSGQTVVSLGSTMARRGTSESSNLSLALAAIIVLLLIPSIICIVLVLLSSSPPLWLIISQLVLFSLSLVVFFFFGVTLETLHSQ